MKLYELYDCSRNVYGEVTHFGILNYEDRGELDDLYVALDYDDSDNKIQIRALPDFVRRAILEELDLQKMRKTYLGKALHEAASLVCTLNGQLIKAQEAHKRAQLAYDAFMQKSE